MYFTASLVGQSIAVGRDLVALAVEDADAELGQVLRILVHVLDQVLLDDALGHRPVGVELDLVDLGIHDRRGALDLADDRGVALHDRAALDRLDVAAGMLTTT